MTRLSKQEYATLLRLVNLYPAIEKMLPLELGVHKQQTIPLRPRLFRFALKVHCRRLGYVTVVSAARMQRHAIDGEPVGYVSRVHRKEAITRLRKMQRAAGQLKTRNPKTRRRSTGPTLSDEIVRTAAKKRPTIVIKKRRAVVRQFVGA